MKNGVGFLSRVLALQTHPVRGGGGGGGGVYKGVGQSM